MSIGGRHRKKTERWRGQRTGERKKETQEGERIGQEKNEGKRREGKESGS